jgi:hypothetical protein
VVLLSLDLKVDVHRKNSSESSEEVATLRPVVEKVSVHRAEQCTQADHEHFRTKLQGNPSFFNVFHVRALYCTKNINHQQTHKDFFHQM